MRTPHAIDREEVAADEHVAIRLQRDRTNQPVRACAGIETAIQTAIGIEAGNPVAVRAPLCSSEPRTTAFDFQRARIEWLRKRFSRDAEKTVRTACRLGFW